MLAVRAELPERSVTPEHGAQPGMPGWRRSGPAGPTDACVSSRSYTDAGGLTARAQQNPSMTMESHFGFEKTQALPSVIVLDFS